MTGPYFFVDNSGLRIYYLKNSFSGDAMSVKRLDKTIALHCNVSRKDARMLIKNGAVKVNGAAVLRADAAVETTADVIEVNGHTFELKEHLYLMMNKPAGVITATSDANKQTVIDIIPDRYARKSLFPCGRLDRDTTGFLLITDDGELSHRLMSPSHHVSKTYIARLDSLPADGMTKKLESGITLADGTECLPCKVKIYEENGCVYSEITITEGKYHQVKRMFAAAGSHVEKLKRIRIGSLSLDPALAEGECREITEDELALLFSENEAK